MHRYFDVTTSYLETKMSETTKLKSCFVVTQIGEEDSPERIHADWVFEEILLPVFGEKFEHYELIRADKIALPGLIDAQIIDMILNADLVIADLTNTNPNVFYEIGIRHVVQKPIIHIHLKGQKIPFDVSLYRSMPFLLSRPSDLKRARLDLGELITSTERPDFAVDNPVVRARGKINFENTATEKDKMIESLIDGLSKRIENIEFINNGDYGGAAENLFLNRLGDRRIEFVSKNGRFSNENQHKVVEMLINSGLGVFVSNVERNVHGSGVILLRRDAGDEAEMKISNSLVKLGFRVVGIQ